MTLYFGICEILVDEKPSKESELSRGFARKKMKRQQTGGKNFEWGNVIKREEEEEKKEII